MGQGLGQGMQVGLAAVLLWGCAVQGVRGDAIAALGGELSPRAGAAVALVRARAALAAQDPGEAARWLESAWSRGGALADDRLVREVLAELPEGVLPEALVGPWEVEQARLAASRGEVAAALTLVRRSLVSVARTRGRTWARARLLGGMLASQRVPAEARQWLRQAAGRSQADAPGRQAAHLARLTLASLWHAEGEYQEAIAAYLGLDAGSGYWRQARLGLAWCQLRAGRPERSLKILALMPGGLTGDPERAVLAAMAAHGLGEVEAARAVVQEAVARAGAWRVPAGLPAQVLAAMAARPRGPLLQEPEDGIVNTLADGARLRLLGGELRASRAEADARPGEPALADWVRRLERDWEREVSEAALGEQARVDEALEQLRLLEPQLQ